MEEKINTKKKNAKLVIIIMIVMIMMLLWSQDIEERSKLRLKTCCAIWYFTIRTWNEDFMLTLAAMKCSDIHSAAQR